MTPTAMARLSATLSAEEGTPSGQPGERGKYTTQYRQPLGKVVYRGPGTMIYTVYKTWIVSHD